MTQNPDIIRSRQPLTKRDLEASLINLKNGQTVSKYLPVQGRILWFHGEVSRYKIDTEMLQLDWNAEFEGEKWGKDETGKPKKVAIKAKGVAVFKAIVTIYSDAGEVMIQVPGHKSEKAVDFPDFMEKAETGSIGRALALAGYGTKFAIELDEGPRIVDAPVERPQTAQPAQQYQHRPAVVQAVPTPPQPHAVAPSQGKTTAQQMTSIVKLSEALGKAVPPPEQVATYEQAKEVIALLSQQYRNSRTKAS